MALNPTEWLIIIVIIVLAYYFLVRRLRKERERRESLILAIIRSRNGATIDELIMGTHLSSETVSKELERLIAKGVIKTSEKEGKTYYITT